MITAGAIRTAFLLWIDAVAQTVNAPLERFRSVQTIHVTEDGDGAFTIRLVPGPKAKAQAPSPLRVRITDGMAPSFPPEWVAAFRGSEVQLELQSSRFLFRSLELPKKASEFLDGIVRAQIDRLTPWNANDVLYHWPPPQQIPGERIRLTIVATARATVNPFVKVLSELGAAAVEIATMTPDPDPARIAVYNRRERRDVEVKRTRLVLQTVFAGTALVAASTIVASGFIGDHYAGEQEQIQRLIAQKRAAIRAGQSALSNSAKGLLERRKHTTPASVLVIEALSAILPDNTYATEVRIDADKLQITGVTGDAASLIQILEQSPHFSQAAFFAPTTRAANEPGERFHIQATIKPHFGAAS
jgi:general secretion pathway protein L